VEERAPWRLAKDPAQAGELDLVLRTLVEGLRTVSVLLWPYLPASTERLLEAMGAPDRTLAGARLGEGTVERVESLEVLFPKAPEGEPGGGGAAEAP
jgi:methionyl-tRNA synthetase